MHALFAALLLAAHLFVSDATTPQVLPARFPGRVLVAAQINGYELWFHLDTGANGLVIDRGEAARVGMRMVNGDAVANVAIGALHASNARFGLLDRYGYEDGGVHVSGLIGTPFFESNVVTIDFLRSQLIVYPNGSFDASKLLVQATPIDFDGGLTRIHAWFGSDRATMLLDTGAETSTLFKPFASDVLLGAPVAGSDGGSMTLGIGTGPSDSYMSLVQPLAIGGVKILRPVVCIVDDPPEWLTKNHFDGILGRDIYKLFRMTIDYGNQVVYLEH